MARRRRRGRRRRRRSGGRQPRDGRDGRRLLPAALDPGGTGARGHRATDGPDLRRRGPSERPAPHRVPRRARPRDSRSPDVAAHAVPSRGGPGAARFGCAGRRVPGRRHHRLGLGQLRDAPLPHRAPSGDDHADVGAPEDPAHLHPRRPPLPRCGGGPSVDGQQAAGDRRSGGAHLPADDAAVRSRGRTATSGDHADQPAHSRALEPLGQCRHAGAPRHRPAPGAVAAAPLGLP